MALTKIGTDGIKDDAVTSDKVANAINSAIAANTAKTSLEDESVTLAKIEHGTSSNAVSYTHLTLPTKRIV